MHFRARWIRIGGWWTILLLGALAGSASAQRLEKEEIVRLQGRVESLLRDELTRNWYPRALDKERGGFHQNFARDWSAKPDDGRSLVYQSRMTWTAATFAEHSPEHAEEFKSYAKFGIAYLDKVMRDREQGGFHWIIDVKGEASSRLGTEKHVYGTAFVLYAASKAYAVTRDPIALKVARDAFAWLESAAHDPDQPGYFEALSRDGKVLRQGDRGNDRLGIPHGFKSMNSHIHLLEAVAEFSRVERTPIVLQRLKELHEIVRDRIAVEPGALNLFFTPDWRAVPAHDSFGHDVETAYLLADSAEALGIPDDLKTWKVARSLIDHALEWGWDEEFGGFYDKGDAFGQPAHDKTKVWWTAAEGLNALLLMHRRFGSETDRYARAFRKQWDFIERHFLDGQYGGWFQDTTRQGVLIGDGSKANAWKANYHTSRAMMNVSRSLREMARDDASKR